MSMLGSLNAAADLVQLGRLHMRPLQFHLLANWKPHRDSLVQPIPISHSCRVAIKWWMNPSIYVAGIPIVIPAPDFHLFSDDSHSGWGAHLEPLGLEVQGLWDVASQDLHINNLELRAVFLALQHFQSHIYNSCVMAASNNSSVVAYLKKQGGTHSPSLCMLVWELLYWCHHRNIHISSQAYSREIECFGRQPVSPRPNSPHRMVSRSGDSYPNFQSLGYSSDRSFRHQIKPSSAPVCFSSTGPQGLCSGCYVTRMEKPIRIRISSIQTFSPGSKQDEGFQQSVHSHSPVLASEELVFSHFESHNRLSQGTSGSSGFGITTSGKSTPSESSYVASSRLEVVRSQIRGRHISEFATQCISQSRRESTLKVYSARLKMFSDWCLQREVNPVDPPLK